MSRETQDQSQDAPSAMKRLVNDTDQWLLRRLRMCIWKSWKLPWTKVKNLVKCGIDEFKAYQWRNTRLGYWRIAGSVILHRAISNENLKRAGTLAFMTNMSNGCINREPLYAERHVQWCKRLVNTKVGDKLLWLVFTSYSIPWQNVLVELFEIKTSSN